MLNAMSQARPIQITLATSQPQRASAERAIAATLHARAQTNVTIAGVRAIATAAATSGALVIHPEQVARLTGGELGWLAAELGLAAHGLMEYVMTLVTHGVSPKSVEWFIVAYFEICLAVRAINSARRN